MQCYRLSCGFLLCLLVAAASCDSNPSETAVCDGCGVSDTHSSSDKLGSADGCDATVTPCPHQSLDLLADADSGLDAACVPHCAALAGGQKECGDDGCGGQCGSCDDQDPCTDDTCSDGVCSHHLSANCCSVEGKMVPPGTPSPQFPCRGCLPGAQQPDWPLLPDGTSCGTTEDPASADYGRCQAGECCHPSVDICWDGQCSCEGGTTYGGCESECDMMANAPIEMALCVSRCGGDCCDTDDQCPANKSRCAPLPRKFDYMPGPVGRCVAPAPYPACWVEADCPEGETCEQAPDLETCPACNADCPDLAPGHCIADL